MKELVGKKKEKLEPLAEKVSNVISKFGYKHTILFEISKRNSVHIVFSTKNLKCNEPNETSIKKSLDYVKGLFNEYSGSCTHTKDWARMGTNGIQIIHYHEIRVTFKRNIAFKLAENHYDFKILDVSLQSIAKFGL